jgi:hypothetical protein
MFTTKTTADAEATRTKRYDEESTMDEDFVVDERLSSFDEVDDDGDNDDRGTINTYSNNNTCALVVRP